MECGGLLDLLSLLVGLITVLLSRPSSCYKIMSVGEISACLTRSTEGVVTVSFSADNLFVSVAQKWCNG